MTAPAYRAEVTSLQNDLAALYQQMGRFEQAERLDLVALKTARQLTADFPKSPFYQLGFASAEMRRGSRAECCRGRSLPPSTLPAGDLITLNIGNHVVREQVPEAGQGVAGSLFLFVTAFLEGSQQESSETDTAESSGEISSPAAAATALAQSTTPAADVADEDVYQQPLYRVAARSELGGSLTASPTAPPGSGGPAVFLRNGRRQNEEEPPQARELVFVGLTRNETDTAASVVEAIAAWAIFQALHSPESQRTTIKPVTPAPTGSANA